MFTLKLDRILGYVTEVCKALAELVILAAFGVALVLWVATLTGMVRWD